MLRELVGEGQTLRSKMAHAAHWLAEPQGSDRFGYYDWRSTVRMRLLDVRPEDAGHFTAPPVGHEVGHSDEYPYADIEFSAGSPNRDMLEYVEVDLEVLTRLLKYYAA